MARLGLIAGGGGLPLALSRHCVSTGEPPFVIRLKGFADPDLREFDGVDLGLAKLGGAFAALHRAGCKTVCFAGTVKRPNFNQIRPDLRGLAAMQGALIAARRGDDGLLAFLVREFEKEGFAVVGAHQVMPVLLLGPGPLGKLKPRSAHKADITAALVAARTIGALDAGQAAVVCDGLVLALEAQEGTDAMLDRVTSLPAGVRGSMSRRRGVIAKACKPSQERRVDLPTIGPVTVERASRAGLAGVVGEASGVLVLEREKVVSLADALGIFICGVA